MSSIICTPPFWGNNGYQVPIFAPKDFIQQVPVPPNARSLFSTAKETDEEVLGPRPSPSKPHSIEVREKAEYLIWRFPDIAATINVPLSTWSDVYKYFNASDISRDGAAHLYNAVDLIAIFNATRTTEVVRRMEFWCSRNKDKVMKGIGISLEDQEALGISDSEMDWYGEVLTMAMNLLALKFKEDCQKRFLNAPVVSSTTVSAEAGASQHFILQDHIPLVNTANDNRPLLSSKSHSQWTPSSSQTIFVSRSRQIEQDISHPGPDVFHGNVIAASIAAGLHDDGGAYQYSTQNNSMMEKSRFDPVAHRYHDCNFFQPSAPDSSTMDKSGYTPIPLNGTASIHHDSLATDLAFQHGQPVYHRNKCSSWSSGSVGRKTSFNPKPIHYSQHVRREFHSPKSKSAQSSDAKVPQSDVSASQLKITKDGTNEVPVYAGNVTAQFTSHCVPSNDVSAYFAANTTSQFNHLRAPFNDGKLSYHQSRTVSDASVTQFGHQTHVDEDETTVWVGGFDQERDTKQLLNGLFSKCGEISSMSPKFSSGKGHPYAFIEFKTPESARLAVDRLNGYSFRRGSYLTVKLKTSRGPYNRRHPLITSRDALQISPSADLHESKRQECHYPTIPVNTCGTSGPLIRNPVLLQRRHNAKRISGAGEDFFYTDDLFASTDLSVAKNKNKKSRSSGDWTRSWSRNKLEWKFERHKLDRSRSGRFINRSNESKLTKANENNPNRSETDSTKNRLNSVSSSDSSTLMGSGSDEGTSTTTRRKDSLLRTKSKSPDILEPIAEIPWALESSKKSDAVQATMVSGGGVKPVTGPMVGSTEPNGKLECVSVQAYVSTPTGAATPQKKKKISSLKNKRIQRHDSIDAIEKRELSFEVHKSGDYGEWQGNGLVRTRSGSSIVSSCQGSSPDSSNTLRIESCPKRVSRDSFFSERSLRETRDQEYKERSPAKKYAHSKKTIESPISCVPQNSQKLDSEIQAGNYAKSGRYRKKFRDISTSMGDDDQATQVAVKSQSTSVKSSGKLAQSDGSHSRNVSASSITSEQRLKKPNTPKHKKCHSSSSGGSPKGTKAAVKTIFQEHGENTLATYPNSTPVSKHGNKQNKPANNKENQNSNKPMNILSDPSQWPALGSKQFLIDPQNTLREKEQHFAQPLAEPQSQLNLRDSMESIVSISFSAQQQARCDIDWSEVCKVPFPKVTRWVQYDTIENVI